MTKSALAELKDQHRRAQGSVNYWSNAVRNARQAADKHTGARQAGDLARLKDFENKAAAAQQQLTKIKAQLTELDPKGAKARQLTALRSAIGRAQQDIAHFEAMTQLPAMAGTPLGQHYKAKLTARRAKLAQLTDALNQERAENEAAAAHSQAMARHMAIVNAAYSFNPCAPDAEQQLQQLDERLARHGLCRLAAADLADRHEPDKPKRPLH